MMNLCNLWKKNYSVCRECGVHFEPATVADTRWGYLCATHRAPVRKQALMNDAVMAWAKDNMPKVKKLMDDEISEREERNKIKYEAIARVMEQERRAMFNQASGQHPHPY